MKTDKATLDAVHPLAWDLVMHLQHVGGVALRDMESMIDTVCKYGFSGGVPGFVYDEDCVTFLRRDGVLYRSRMALRDYADGVGDPLWEVATRTVAGGHVCAEELRDDQARQMDGARALVLPLDELVQSRDVVAQLVWFAAQRAAYAFEDCDVKWREGGRR